uniref:NADH-ubiquinone oxidoreductase chain 6 n=1 Tax=Lebbeus groenlandicus TaxID=397956 RepID=A0A649UC98_9EUCA|nr:NADH dehydrogenase subunit 6 [Lebbeus groenlandicus]QGI24752.1 NADH dehydrogenase subunit 6 [Lebbeus groenlandicus]
MSLTLNMMSLILTTSLIFSQMTQPLSMGLMIVVQTILIAFVAGVGSNSTWFSYILFLVFLGAMLVLFLYVASLAPNEAFPISSTMIAILLIGILSPLPLFLLDQMAVPLKMTIEGTSFSAEQIMISAKYKLGLMYSLPSMNLTMYIIMYLLLTLIVVVKITNTFFGPLRLT